MAELIHDVLTEAAQAAPEREAVLHRRDAWTYRRLEVAADAVAAALVARGVRPGDRVAYWAPKVPEAVAAFYGVLRAGAVWVPIDPSAPSPWMSAVAAHCEVSAFVTTADRAPRVASTSGPGADPFCLLLPGDVKAGRPDVPHMTWEEAMAATPGASPDVGVRDMEMAAIFYTSGSTGVPKGVMHHHRSLMTSAAWLVDLGLMDQQDRIPVFPPLHFKMSTYGLISSVMARATSILVSLETGFRGSDLVDLVRRQEVTIWRSISHPLQVLAGAAPSAGSLPSLRLVALGGGGLRSSDVRTIRVAAPNAALWQTYGSTESGTICAHRIASTPEPGQPIQVGRPLSHARTLLLRDDGSAAGPGEPGEMCVWSPKVMMGYWGDPETTSSVLVADPTGNDPDQLWYLTHDLVRLRDDGDYEFIGRRDDMVKSRGYRVELGQVEIALASHPGVRESAAIALPPDEWGKSIVGFVALSEAGWTEGQLRAHVAAQLPVYMVPQRIHLLEALPRTSTGKPDRRLLVELASDRVRGEA